MRHWAASFDARSSSCMRFEAAWLALCICMAMYRAMAMYAMHDAKVASLTKTYAGHYTHVNTYCNRISSS
jgi:hypothetical protein